MIVERVNGITKRERFLFYFAEGCESIVGGDATKKVCSLLVLMAKGGRLDRDVSLCVRRSVARQVRREKSAFDAVGCGWVQFVWRGSVSRERAS